MTRKFLKRTGTFLVYLSATFTSRAQAPTIEWQKILNNEIWSEARSVQQTADGGYIVAGSVVSNEELYDYLVIKFTATGVVEWQKTYGGSAYDRAYSIAQTTDGGYIVAGVTTSYDGNVTGNHGGGGDYWVVKLSATGAIQWQKTYGGSDTDWAYSITQTTDGGYIVAGYSSSTNGDVTGNQGYLDYWIIKLNTTGTIEWQKSYGGNDADMAYSVQQTADNGYIVAGSSTSKNGNVTGNNGYEDYWIIKLSSTGVLEWQKSLGGNDTDIAYSVLQTTDGGYITAGFSYSTNGNITNNHGVKDYWIVKLSATGTIEWQKSLGGNSNDEAYSIQQTTDNGYIVAGTSFSTNGDVTGNHGGSSDYWIVKLSATGTIEWQKSLGGSSSDVAYAIQQTADKGYVIAGVSTSTDGDVTGNNGNNACWVAKLSEATASTTTFTTNQISLYPNPTNGILKISETAKNVKVMDITGKTLLTQGNTTQIDMSNFAKGVYLVTLETENGEKQTQKVVKK